MIIVTASATLRTAAPVRSHTETRASSPAAAVISVTGETPMLSTVNDRITQWVTASYAGFAYRLDETATDL